MPLDTKIDRMAPGDQVTEADGDTTAAPNNRVPKTAGSPLPNFSAGTDAFGAEPNSRRLAAATVHANGAAAGSPPRPPPTSHANRPELRPLTDPDADARGAAIISAATARGAIDITGATTGAADNSADEPNPARSKAASTGSGTTATGISSDVVGDITPGRGSSRVESTPADTTAPARRCRDLDGAA